MELFLTMLVPLLMLGIALWGLIRKVDLWTALVDGAGDGLKVTLRIAPPLIALGQVLEPVLSAVGIPVETIGLILVRPVSGSAALGVGAELIETYGPDSLIGRTAAVMLGSTETTFYTIAVYFGAAKVAKTRYAVPAALCGDVAGFLAASWAVRLLFKA